MTTEATTTQALVARDVVRLSGPDAATYLQGQVSQAVDRLAVGESAWSLVLQPQGKVDSWCRIHRSGDLEFVLDIDAGFGPAMVTRLERFKLRTDAEFTVLEDWAMLAVRGDGLTVPSPTDGQLVASVEWPGFSGYDILGADLAEPSNSDATALEILRIRAGWPAMGAELTEDTIPAEANVIDQSVSFTKGCFVGQELVARIDSRGGNVPRPVRRFVVDGVDTAAEAGAVKLVSPGDDVRDGEDIVGSVTSVAFDPAAGEIVGLAAVMRKIEVPGKVTVGSLSGADLTAIGV